MKPKLLLANLLLGSILPGAWGAALVASDSAPSPPPAAITESGDIQGFLQYQGDKFYVVGFTNGGARLTVPGGAVFNPVVVGVTDTGSPLLDTRTLPSDYGSPFIVGFRRSSSGNQVVVKDAGTVLRVGGITIGNSGDRNTFTVTGGPSAVTTDMGIGSVILTYEGLRRETTNNLVVIADAGTYFETGDFTLAGQNSQLWVTNSTFLKV